MIYVEVRKMSNKRKLPTILGVCAATVLAAGGSAFLTDTALSLLEKQTQVVRETGSEPGQRETELPIRTEEFTKTEDSFLVSAKPVSAQKETEKKTPATEDGDEKQTEKEPETEKETEKKPETEPASEKTTESAAPAQTEKPSPQTEAQSVLPGTMYARSSVYVRSGAGMDNEILGVLGEGDGVMATGKKQGSWIEVNYDGKTGYVGGSYLTSEYVPENTAGGSGSGSAGSGSNTSGSSGSTGSGGNTSGSGGGNSSGGNSGPAVIVTSGTMYAKAGVNVRGGAGKEYDVLGAINTGESIGVTGNASGNWTEVVYGGQIGYIYSSYLVWDPDEIESGNSGSSGGSGAWDDSYIYDVSSYYCDESEFDGWSATDLAYLRNEIFARHGRIFNSETYRSYFSQKTWYKPTYDPSYFDANLGSFLNDYEWANLKLIQRLEDARY